MIAWTKHDCFQHDMAYNVYKDIQKRKASGKVLSDEFRDQKSRDTTQKGTGICNAVSDTIQY